MPDLLLLYLLEKPGTPLAAVTPTRLGAGRQYFSPGTHDPALYHPVAKHDPQAGWYVSTRRPLVFISSEKELPLIDRAYREAQTTIAKAALPMLRLRGTGGERFREALLAFQEHHRYLTKSWFYDMEMYGYRVVWPSEKTD